MLTKFEIEWSCTAYEQTQRIPFENPLIKLHYLCLMNVPRVKHRAPPQSSCLSILRCAARPAAIPFSRRPFRQRTSEGHRRGIHEFTQTRDNGSRYAKAPSSPNNVSGYRGTAPLCSQRVKKGIHVFFTNIHISATKRSLQRDCSGIERQIMFSFDGHQRRYERHIVCGVFSLPEKAMEHIGAAAVGGQVCQTS